MIDNILLRSVALIGYILLLLVFFLSPFVWGFSGLRNANKEAFIYRFFPEWAKWIAEGKYAFWK